ncbi:MAG TPA: RimK-like ATPgrasp N-terminal domain-containing protein, partial [Ramlibacter sp.]
MRAVFVVDREQEWFEIPDAAELTVGRYLAEPDSGLGTGVQVLNLSRTGRYQGRGYYVSLLAEARGHRPLPDVKTVEDLKSEAHVRAIAAQLETLVHETLHHDESDRFQLDVYLGKDPARRHQALAETLFASVRTPLLRALFARKDGRWRLDALQAIGIADVPSQDRAFLLE